MTEERFSSAESLYRQALDVLAVTQSALIREHAQRLEADAKLDVATQALHSAELLLLTMARRAGWVEPLEPLLMRLLDTQALPSSATPSETL